MKKNKAFTLAEIIVTLGIIGVVAMLTIPSLTQTSTSRAEYVALTKAYSTLANATQTIEAKNGHRRFWGWGERSKIYEKYRRELSTVSNDSYGYRLITADGMVWTLEAINSNCNGSGNNYSSDNYCGLFRVDVNGAQGTGTPGRDVFYFVVTKDSVLPTGHLNPTEACSDWTGNNCAARAINCGGIGGECDD